MNKQITNKKENGIVLYAHPYPKSFSAAMKDVAVKSLESKGLKVTLYDLAKMNYNAKGDIKPTAAFNKKLKEYQKTFKNAKDIILVYPTWWSSAPAHMEIFLENVLEKNVFYKSKDGIATAKKNKIKNIYAFSTSFTPNIISKFILRNPSKNKFKSMAKTIGAEKFIFRNLERITAGQKRREKYLVKIEKIIKGVK